MKIYELQKESAKSRGNFRSVIPCDCLLGLRFGEGVALHVDSTQERVVALLHDHWVV